MLEDFIIELERPNKATRILLDFLRDFICNEYDFSNCSNQRIKTQYVLSLIYALNLINENIAKLKREYYKMMLKEKYHQN